MTLTLPHLRHQWTVVATASGQLTLHCARCRKTTELEKLHRRIGHGEKLVVR